MIRRLKDAAQFPVAAKAGFDNVRNTEDLITDKLPALHVYQLAIPAPAPPAGSFDHASALRGKTVFTGKAQCSTCHVGSITTEPGWNMHTAAEVCVDDFQANRAPDHRYRTAPLNGLWTHTKGGFYHDGRFATLGDVIDHYDSCFNLGLSPRKKAISPNTCCLCRKAIVRMRSLTISERRWRGAVLAGRPFLLHQTETPAARETRGREESRLRARSLPALWSAELASPCLPLWMCAHNAVIARMSCHRSVHVAGAEVKKAVRAFHHIANAAKLVLPEDLLHGHHAPARTIQKNLVNVMSEGVVGVAKQANQHASIPAGNDRPLIERHAGGRSSHR